MQLRRGLRRCRRRGGEYGVLFNGRLFGFIDRGRGRHEVQSEWPWIGMEADVAGKLDRTASPQCIGECIPGRRVAHLESVKECENWSQTSDAPITTVHVSKTNVESQKLSQSRDICRGRCENRVEANRGQAATHDEQRHACRRGGQGGGAHHQGGCRWSRCHSRRRGQRRGRRYQR